jgi:hypothetical protein
MTLTTGGNVGVGTTTPSSRLDVLASGSGDVAVLRVPASSRLINFYRDSVNFAITDASGVAGNGMFGITTTNTLAFLTNSSERMRIDSSGNVGIGTSSPSAQLHVTGTSANGSYGAIIYNNNALGQGLTIRAGSTSSQDAFNIQTYNGGSSLFTAQGGGNVGIGTSSPSQRLEAYQTFSYNAGIQTIAVLTHDASGNAAIDGSGPALRLDYVTGVSPTRYQMGQVGGAFITSGLGNLASGLYLNTVNTSNTLATAAIVTNSGIGLGNNIPSSGVGIRFPATQSASSDANTLDDYEEGTFTPTAFGQTSAGTTTYTQQHGFYTKIGRQVTVIIFINWTAMTGTGILRVGSLPFTSSNLGQSYSVGAVLTDGLNWTAGTSIVSIQFDNTNFIQFEGIGDDLSSGAQLCVNETTGIRLTLTYFV